MTLFDAILQKQPLAFAQLQTLLRAQGKKHDDVIHAIRLVFTAAGREPPDWGEVDDILAEAEAIESRS